MKYTIDRTEKLAGKNLILGRYVRLDNVGEGWTFARITHQPRVRMAKTTGKRTITSHIEEIATTSKKAKNRTKKARVFKFKFDTMFILRIIEKKAPVYKPVTYTRYRLAKDDTHEYILQCVQVIHGIRQDIGQIFTSVYARRPKKARKTKTQNAPAAPTHPQTLTREEWNDFLK